MMLLILVLHIFMVKYVLCINAPLVSTPVGSFLGVYSEESRNFYGIPFAKPPVGPLRWKPPVAMPPWAPYIYSATSLKSACTQIDCSTRSPEMVCPSESSEDCLTLNVFTPLNVTDSSQLPVMVFIHGGNFLTMWGGSLLYRGDMFVHKGNVILVTINYRLGVMGFLVTDQGTDPAMGNFGIQDQRLALEWVRDNIRGFGGDPAQVTIFGQSAGAQSVAIHMTSPRSNDLFKGAIMQSNPFVLDFTNRTQSVELGEHLAQHLNCRTGDLTCLRSHTWQDVTGAGFRAEDDFETSNYLERAQMWGPSLDDDHVPGQLFPSFLNGTYQQKPFIVGSTADDALLLVFRRLRSPASIFTYLGFAATLFGRDTARVFSKYPLLEYTDTREQMSQIGTDFIFECPTRSAARAAASLGRPAWNYIFDDSIPEGWGNLSFCNGRACHGVELVYEFQTPKYFGLNFNSSQTTVSDTVIRYWTNFAKYGTPNSPDQTAGEQTWPLYEGPAWNSMKLSSPSAIVPNDKKEKCDLWDSMGYILD